MIDSKCASWVGLFPPIRNVFRGFCFKLILILRSEFHAMHPMSTDIIKYVHVHTNIVNNRRETASWDGRNEIREKRENRLGCSAWAFSRKGKRNERFIFVLFFSFFFVSGCRGHSAHIVFLLMQTNLFFFSLFLSVSFSLISLYNCSQSNSFPGLGSEALGMPETGVIVRDRNCFFFSKIIYSSEQRDRSRVFNMIG